MKTKAVKSDGGEPAAMMDTREVAAYLRLTVRDAGENDRLIAAASDLATKELA